ncbi:MAG: hypothetical protein ACK46T_13300, partial [Bradyrhizobium sp.]
ACTGADRTARAVTMVVMNIGPAPISAVIPRLLPGNHLSPFSQHDVDGRDGPGHDEASEFAS